MMETLNQNQKETIAAADKFVNQLFKGESTGHDYYHTFRVVTNSYDIYKSEGGDLFIILLSSYLHDVDDRKLFENEEKHHNALKFLKENKVDVDASNKILKIIDEISFKGEDTLIPSSLEWKIVQDGDRLDALGAIGIARAFAYGGHKNRSMYDPSIKPRMKMNEKEYFSNNGTTINHFYEKLFLLPDLMNTKSGKGLALKRKKFMEDFLDEFYLEWER